ncbi:hypothetical protein [Gracilimonas tropica]|uniref:hypothetical protein n=1 Tax=Gracilimonas tropica TaxID=454600 RepID=UPI0003A3D595|nr:hypothetical protein [Gracilimonas tropica]
MKKIPLDIATKIARRLTQLMAPHCYRVEVAGSVRRQKAEVSDIEIVAHPKKYWVKEDLPQKDIFAPSKTQVQHSELVDKCLAVLPNVEWIKPGFKDTSMLIEKYGKEVLTEVPELGLGLDREISRENNYGLDRKHWKGLTWYKDLPVKIDIFLAGSDNFGVIHFIRTGPKDFNVKMIAKLKSNGYNFEDGYLVHLPGSQPEKENYLGTDRREFCHSEDMIFEKAGMGYIKPSNRN